MPVSTWLLHADHDLASIRRSVTSRSLSGPIVEFEGDLVASSCPPGAAPYVERQSSQEPYICCAEPCSAFAAFLAPPIAVQAQDEPKPGTLGFAIDVDGEGFFLNPTLKTVTIKSVVPGRPAATAGIKPGDQIVEVEGRQVTGTKARELQPLMRKNAGETLALRLRKPSGEVYAVSLVAAPKD